LVASPRRTDSAGH